MILNPIIKFVLGWFHFSTTIAIQFVFFLYSNVAVWNLVFISCNFYSKLVHSQTEVLEKMRISAFFHLVGSKPKISSFPLVCEKDEVVGQRHRYFCEYSVISSLFPRPALPRWMSRVSCEGTCKSVRKIIPLFCSIAKDLNRVKKTVNKVNCDKRD